MFSLVILDVLEHKIKKNQGNYRRGLFHNHKTIISVSSLSNYKANKYYFYIRNYDNIGSMSSSVNVSVVTSKNLFGCGGTGKLQWKLISVNYVTSQETD